MISLFKLLQRTAPLFILTALSAQSTQANNVENLSIKKHAGDQVVDLEPQTMVGLLKTRKGLPYSTENFDADLKRLAKLYNRIDPKISERSGGVDIELHVYPKEQIREVTWSGNRKFSTEKLNKLLQIKSGDILDEQTIVKALGRVRAHYIKNGYYQAQFDFNFQTNKKADFVDLQFTCDEGQRNYIKKIVFEGITKEEKSQFWEFLTSSPYRPILSAITSSGRLSKEIAEQDALVLVEFLQNLGYADATASIEIEPVTTSEFVILKFKATKGQLYRVGNVDFVGNTTFEKEVLRKKLKIKEGDVLSPSQVKRSLQALMNHYGSKGYIEADLNVRIDLRDRPEEQFQQDVVFVIDEGQPFKVGLISVRGNLVTHAKVILHECLLSPGEVFNSLKIAATEQRLLNTDLFESVRVFTDVKTQTEKHDLQKRDVVIEVEEKSTGKVILRAGKSNEDAGFVGIDVVEPNFNIAGIPKILKKGYRNLRGGGENAELGWQLGSSNRKLNLVWTKPYFKDTPWTVGAELEHLNHKIPKGHYSTKGRGINLFARYPLNPFVHFETHYRIKHTSSKVNREASARLREEAATSGSISAVGVGLQYDSTNSVFKATKGFISHAGVEVAGLGGNFKFIHWDYANSLYLPVKQKGTLKFRADLHLIKPYGRTQLRSLPLSERLFMGGETSIRGYRPDSIGPKFEGFDADEPRGGLSSLLLSAEYLHPLTKLGTNVLDGFVFIDAGTLGEKALRLDKHWTSSYGFGIRLDISERIPLILGLGYPLKKPKDRNIELQKFFFSIGAKF